MAQSPVCAGRGHSGPAGPSASSVSSSCPFHMWLSCRQTTGTSWSRCRSLEYHLQGGKSELRQGSLPPLNGAFDLVYEMEEMGAKPAEPDLPLSPPGRYLLRCHPHYLAQCCTVPPVKNTLTLTALLNLNYFCLVLSAPT